ncbi:MAG: hypothetical protein ACYTCU_05125 [Planctomycetota bacterium]
MIRFFLFGPGAVFTVYLGAQVLAVLRLAGRWRLAALLPVPFMGWIAVKTVEAYEQDSNLRPAGLLLWSAVAAVYLGVVLLAGELRLRRA